MHAYDTDFVDALAARSVRRHRPDVAGQQQAVALARPYAASAAAILRLQRSAGNAAVSSLVQRDEESPVKQVISSGGGKPLDRDTRTEMEGRFGYDFSDVRVHTDSAASESAKAVNAHAYTAGTNVVFQRDRYSPDTDAGKRTLAHELTHVIQQKSGPVDGTPAGGGITLSDPSDRFEREAVTSADRVMSQPAAVAASADSGSGAAVQRCGPGCDDGEAVQRQEAAPPAEEEKDEEAPSVQGEFVQRQEDEEEESA